MPCVDVRGSEKCVEQRTTWRSQQILYSTLTWWKKKLSKEPGFHYHRGFGVMPCHIGVYVDGETWTSAWYRYYISRLVFPFSFSMNRSKKFSFDGSKTQEHPAGNQEFCLDPIRAIIICKNRIEVDTQYVLKIIVIAWYKIYVYSTRLPAGCSSYDPAYLMIWRFRIPRQAHLLKGFSRNLTNASPGTLLNKK